MSVTPTRLPGQCESQVSSAAEPQDDGLTPPSSPGWVDPRSNGLLSLFFVALLLAPFVVYAFGRKTETTFAENRALAPAPVFGADPIAALPAEMEAYYADRFGFRSSLIHIYGVLFRQWLRASNNDLVIGKDRWIFYARDNIFEDFMGMSPFSEAELRRWRDYLEDRRETLARHRIQYLFVVGPDKNTIYPEKLPDYLRQRRGRSRWEQLSDYLRSTGSPADVLDLHDALLRAKAQGNLYFPQDTHWNGRGFFVAYQAICLALGRWFPEITPQALGQSYTLQSFQTPLYGDWGLIGLPEQNFTYMSEFLVPLGTEKARKMNASPLPDGIQAIPEHWLQPLLWIGPGHHRLLIFHDSYMTNGTWYPDGTLTEGNPYYQPLAEHFAQTLLIGHRKECEEQLLIDQFHPDVVIEEHVERALLNIPPPRQSCR